MDAELPELLQLLTELSEKVGEANDHVSLLRDEASQLDTERGVSLLELKNHVLLRWGLRCVLLAVPCTLPLSAAMCATCRNCCC